MTTLRITASLWVAGFRGGLEYRTDFVLMTLMGLVRQGVGFALIWVILARFEMIAGWTLGEVTFLYGMRLTMLALCGLATGNIWSMQDFVRLGEFDRFLVRPVRPLLQLLTLRVPISAFGDLLGGVALIAAATRLVDVAWTPWAILYLLLALGGGALIQLAMRLLIVSFSFRALSVDGLMAIVDDLFNDFGTYPLNIFNSGLQLLLTFGIPVAFMAYFPAVVLFSRTSEIQIHPIFAYSAPLAGVVWMAIAMWVFEREMRSYQSSGH
jgi:ABC-2 type transport system permease protein